MPFFNPDVPIGLRAALAGLAGLGLGSFANVCIHRIPRGRSIVFPGSHCPGCGSPLRWYDNIPILSFAFLRGRCRRCRRTISWQYPLVEALTGALFAVTASSATFTATGLAQGLFFVLVLVIVSGIDFHLKIIPDVLSLGLLSVGLVQAPINPFLGDAGAERILRAVAGASTGFGLLWAMGAVGERVFKKEALGGGDVKLMAGVGAFLGPAGVVAAIFCASFLGTAVFVILKAMRRMTWGAYLPFGPFLAAGAWLYYRFPVFWDRWWAL